ncbi:phosphatase PAP2 family protein [Micromonospora sp. CPCC 206061]|uniref:phosphatase PAP2 family protein n=1 Tax=Micromonospora sp. CPCC 206061 TaxID=3122410 RepID=UPI002FEF551A
MTGVERLQHERRTVDSGASPIRLVPQIAILIGAICVYFGVRGATEGSVSQALANAQRVVDFERFLGIYHEPWLQETFASSATVKTFFNWIYIWGHWPVIAVTLIWLARRHPAIYLRTRNAMMLSGGIGMIIFAAFPVAPPRLAELGMIDTVTVSSHAYRVLQPPMFTNQYAAVPSLHVGWDLLIGIAIAVAARRLWVRVIGVIMPVAMTAAVVLTANHYLVDAVAGAALTTAAWFACGWWLRRRAPGSLPALARVPLQTPAPASAVARAQRPAPALARTPAATLPVAVPVRPAVPAPSGAAMSATPALATPALARRSRANARDSISIPRAFALDQRESP